MSSIKAGERGCGGDYPWGIVSQSGKQRIICQKKGIDMAWSGRGILGVLTCKGGNMDELSPQARLAKSNINITDMKEDRVFFEFPYHPRPGEVRWVKTFIKRKRVHYLSDEGVPMNRPQNDREVMSDIADMALDIRTVVENR